MLRVLVVDDSPTARELIVGILENDPEIQIAGCACNGDDAVSMVDRLRPDVVTMDVHMPILNGLDATKKIMSTCATPIVIVSSSTLVNDVQWAMKALQAGALTLLMKPEGPTAPDFVAVSKELTETVKAMAGVKVIRRRNHQPRTTDDPKTISNQNRGALRAVAIAASTGGPPVILQILSCLPADFCAPILIVQHIAAGFSDGFVTWLDNALSLKVKIAQQDEPLQDGVVYVAPEQTHLGVSRRGTVKLSDDPPIGGFRPSATHLFESVGHHYGASSLGIILTGMGNDGVDGLRTLSASGGRVIAQDEESCVVFGMPKEAQNAGFVDVSLPPEEICQAILRISQKQ